MDIDDTEYIIEYSKTTSSKTFSIIACINMCGVFVYVQSTCCLCVAVVWCPEQPVASAQVSHMMAAYVGRSMVTTASVK